MSRSSMFGTSQFDQVQQRFQAAHGGGGRPQPGGQFVRPTHQDTILHSAGLRPALKSGREQFIRHKQNKSINVLRQSDTLRKTNILSWQSQKQITLFPPDKTYVAPRSLSITKSYGNGFGLDSWQLERDLMLSRFENSAKGVWNFYIDIWRFYEPANLARIFVKPQVNTAMSVVQFYKRNTPQVISDGIDGLAFLSLLGYANSKAPGTLILDEKEEEHIFKTSPVLSTGILLNEFAFGSGPDQRTFTLNQAIAKQFLTGYVIEDVVNGLYETVNNPSDKITYNKFLSLRHNEAVSYGLFFSPTSNPSTWIKSFDRHRSANDVQFFIGGASIKVLPSVKRGWAVVNIINKTSRSSLMLHIGDNYDRNIDDRQLLSTITQNFKFSIKIDPNKFPLDERMFSPNIFMPAKPRRVPWK